MADPTTPRRTFKEAVLSEGRKGLVQGATYGGLASLMVDGGISGTLFGAGVGAAAGLGAGLILGAEEHYANSDSTPTPRPMPKALQMSRCG